VWVGMRGFSRVSGARRWSELGSTGQGIFVYWFKIFDHQTDMELI
jgi:hypothetical protein